MLIWFPLELQSAVDHIHMLICATEILKNIKKEHSKIKIITFMYYVNTTLLLHVMK